MNWIPVEEQLPNTETFVLACMAHKNYFYHEVVKIDQDTNKWTYNNGTAILEGHVVTAWQHLPGIFVK